VNVDALSALIRALSFFALFQAAGVAMMIALIGPLLDQSAAPIRRIGFYSAIAGLLLVSMHYAIEAARMSGSLAGVLDRDLQQMVFDSSMSTAAGMRLLGLALIAGVIRRQSSTSAVVGLAGAFVLTLAFTFVGHTADESRTSWLAVLLTLHLLVVAFWFGGLAPLLVIARREHAARAANIVATFTRIATIVVPGLFVAGVLMTLLLVDAWEVFGDTYGQLLLGKAAGFALLMVLASLNKWRYGPAIDGDGAGTVAFQRTVAIEYVLICSTLVVTAIMTTFYSPSR
jgi:putative copper resistance protein D